MSGDQKMDLCSYVGLSVGVKIRMRYSMIAMSQK